MIGDPRGAPGDRVPRRPRFSIVVPVYESEPRHLVALLRSIRDQRWVDWECQLVDDGSPDPSAAAIVRSFVAVDPRFALTVRDRNGGIAAATNDAIALASGDWVVFSDHDDVVHAAALERIARWAALHPTDHVIYTDEQVIDGAGNPVVEHRKPDFSPERLLGQNYLAHLVAVRADLLDRIRRPDGTWLDATFEPCQDNDLVLRATEAAVAAGASVGHVPEVLYSWRAAAGSIAESTDHKAGVAAAVAAAATAHLTRTGDPGRVEPVPGSPTTVRIRRDPPPHPVIAHVGPADWANAANTALTDPTVTHLALPISELNQSHVADSLRIARGNTGDEGWLAPLLALCDRPGVGAAGPRLLDATGRLVSAGRVHHPALRDFDRGDPGDAHGPWGAFLVARECSSLHPAGLVVRADAARTVGGLAEDVGLDAAVAELCTRLRLAGYRIIWSPVATVVLRSENAAEHPDDLARRDRDVATVAGRLPEITDDPYSPVGSFRR